MHNEEAIFIFGHKRKVNVVGLMALFGITKSVVCCKLAKISTYGTKITVNPYLGLHCSLIVALSYEDSLHDPSGSDKIIYKTA